MELEVAATAWEPRRLAPMQGEVYRVGNNWSCPSLKRCDQDPSDAPPSNDTANATVENVIPGGSQCSDTRYTGPLQTTMDVDLRCIDSNYTCADIDGNATLQAFRLNLFEGCTNDPDLTFGECQYRCGLGNVALLRCVHQFDRNGKYGLLNSDFFDTCIDYQWCADDGTRLYSQILCNKSTALLNREYARMMMQRSRPDAQGAKSRNHDEEVKQGLTIGLSVAICTLIILCCVIGVLIYWFKCRKPKGPTNSQPVEQPTGAGFVVGRPVTDQQESGVSPSAGTAVGKVG